jgi:hypothetical protein
MPDNQPYIAPRSERDSSETTRDRMKCGAGDVADSPTPRSGGSPKGILLRKIQ